MGNRLVPTSKTETLELSLSGFDGTEVHLSVPEDILGIDLVRRVRCQIAPKLGALHVFFGDVQLSHDQTLQQQGLNTDSVGSITCTPNCLLKAWNVLKGHDMDDSQQVLEGVTQMSVDGLYCILPLTLQSLTFGDSFDQSLHGVALPGRLQSLTFGRSFDQSLDRVTLPASLQSLTFGSKFDQRLKGVTLPGSLQSLTFGYMFNQKLDGVALPGTLQSLTFGGNFDQRLERVTLPGSLQSLTFGQHFNQRLDGATLPQGLQTLTFGWNFNQRLDAVTLPSRLQRLTFGCAFNQRLDAVALPGSLRSLTFGGTFDQSLDRVTLPSSLQSLTFGDSFNQSLEGVTFPGGLQSLTFGYMFDQSLDGATLPDSLQNLTFGGSFDQRLERVTLPGSLQSLTFGCMFNQALDGVTLPGGLQSLTFGYRFKQSLDGVSLPGSLQSLTFAHEFKQSLDGVALPGSLQSLTFGQGQYFSNTLAGGTFGGGMQKLILDEMLNQSLDGVIWPGGLQSLTLGNYFDQSLDGVTLPGSLQSLTFGWSFDHSLDRETLPGSLQSLTFGHDFNQHLDGVILPGSLQRLSFGHEFNQRLIGVTLPGSLQSLTFGYMFNQALDGVTLPGGLQSLTFGYRFNQALDGVTLPGSLQSLTFGDMFNQVLDGVTLPGGLQSLSFGDMFNQGLAGVSLPVSLQSLTFGHNFNQHFRDVEFAGRYLRDTLKSQMALRWIRYHLREHDLLQLLLRDAAGRIPELHGQQAGCHCRNHRDDVGLMLMRLVTGGVELGPLFAPKAMVFAGVRKYRDALMKLMNKSPKDEVSLETKILAASIGGFLYAHAATAKADAGAGRRPPTESETRVFPIGQRELTRLEPWDPWLGFLGLLAHASAPPRYDGPDPVAAAEAPTRRGADGRSAQDVSLALGTEVGQLQKQKPPALAKSQAEAELQVRQLSEMQQKAHEQSLALAQDVRVNCPDFAVTGAITPTCPMCRLTALRSKSSAKKRSSCSQPPQTESGERTAGAVREQSGFDNREPDECALSAALAPVHSDLARVEALVGSQVSETLRAMASQSQERSAFVAALADQQRAPVQVSDASAQTQDDKKKEHEALFSVLPWAGRSCRRSERFRPAPSAKRALCAPPDMALTEEEAKAFYEDNDGEPATAEQIKEAEEKLNHKLPEAYKTLLAVKNGGRPSKSCAPTKSGTSWAQDHVAIEELLAVQEIAGETADYVSEWEYPEIGLVIGSCPSGGHDLIWLDYRKCGPQGEPLVVHVDQEFDFKVTHLADDFASFVRNLKSEEEFDPEGPEKKAKTGEEGEGEEDE
ncbi:unnamed protein product [Effrenium voratum]|uniref:Knr4/Smi1-like domain-containing protein n=1 Tax=Effrenium voratum TaxID=2562239 RepID=A0AA36IRC9_9DINO|nr:unnamed protein product [Effrenium voratum]